MAKKKVIYQITRTKYQIVEVETEEQEELIKELNRDFEREDKREKTAQARYISLDYLFESEGYEPPDNSLSAEEKYIEREQKEIFSARLHKAIESLTPRQKGMVIMVYFEGKSQVEVAKELKVTEGTVSKTLERALINLKKFLEKK